MIHRKFAQKLPYHILLQWPNDIVVNASDVLMKDMAEKVYAF